MDTQNNTHAGFDIAIDMGLPSTVALFVANGKISGIIYLGEKKSDEISLELLRRFQKVNDDRNKAKHISRYPIYRSWIMD